MPPGGIPLRPLLCELEGGRHDHEFWLLKSARLSGGLIQLDCDCVPRCEYVFAGYGGYRTPEAAETGPTCYLLQHRAMYEGIARRIVRRERKGCR